MQAQEAISAARLKRRVGSTMTVLVDEVTSRGAIARSAADAPEIDGVVHLLPAEKISKRIVAGEFTQARVVGTQGHDLVAVPI